MNRVKSLSLTNSLANTGSKGRCAKSIIVNFYRKTCRIWGVS